MGTLLKYKNSLIRTVLFEKTYIVEEKILTYNVFQSLLDFEAWVKNDYDWKDNSRNYTNIVLSKKSFKELRSIKPYERNKKFKLYYMKIKE